MKIQCVWEHNGPDTLLYAANLPGVYTRGENLEAALEKLPGEVCSYLRWLGKSEPEEISWEVVQEAPCSLRIRDADSDVLFDSERDNLTREEYEQLKALALKSAADFLKLYHSIPEKHTAHLPPRRTFYGDVPRTAEQMYRHTKNVNAYYFAEIGVNADNEGTILECRTRGFSLLEEQEGFPDNRVQEGSYGEIWSLRKVLRRFIWHDRIHARAMYRLALSLEASESVENVFCF